MIKKNFEIKRDNKKVDLSSDLVVVGGGMAGVCCAITAARAGVQVILVQDRPVIGGNASSEVRLWILGATSHMGNNNRWAREGGVIDEILLENAYRNKEGNPLIVDSILLEKALSEPNIKLLLNTAVYQVNKRTNDEIASVIAFCSQNSTSYELSAPLFCDASGDGIVAFQAGASFRMGAESPDEFDEGFAPDVEDYGELLGHSMYFYTKDVGKPVRFVAPSFALKDVSKLPNLKSYKIDDHGCRLWWVEWGGRMDTVHDTETIKWELWKVVYGIWDYVKNSGKYPESETLTLEWVGTIPGKRESRRFEGDYILKQQDIVGQGQHHDAVAFGGWAIDLHPADGVYSKHSSCSQWHSKGIYQIPYQCYYSKDIKNLFLAGRIISVSHIAFGSSRVMATCALGGQAVGMAAFLAARQNLLPRDLSKSPYIEQLQIELNKAGQSIPLVPLVDETNLVNDATISASSHLTLSELPADGPWMSLQNPSAQLLPMQKDTHYEFEIYVNATNHTNLDVQLRTSSKCHNFTPDVILETIKLELDPGEQWIAIKFDSPLPEDHSGFVCFMRNKDVSIKGSEQRVPGMVSVFNKKHKEVSNHGRQDPPKDSGLDAFEFWCPDRRPNGHNLGFRIKPSIDCYSPMNINNGVIRPTANGQSNAWASSLDDPTPSIKLRWSKPQRIRSMKLFFDTDFDHPLESVLLGHPENVMPFCVRNYSILDDQDRIVHAAKDNYQTIDSISFEQELITEWLEIQLKKPSDKMPATLFQVLCH